MVQFCVFLFWMVHFGSLFLPQVPWHNVYAPDHTSELLDHLHQTAPNCTKVQKPAPNYDQLHQPAPTYAKLHQLRPTFTQPAPTYPNSTKHQDAQTCTKLNQAVPIFTKLHQPVQSLPTHIKCHLVATSCSNLLQTAPTCSKLHQAAPEKSECLPQCFAIVFLTRWRSFPLHGVFLRCVCVTFLVG